MERLDHGMLNIPLAKRGDIDAQIDRHKRESMRAKRQEDAARFHSGRTKKAKVAEHLARIGDYRIMQLAAPLGCRKPSTARAALLNAAGSNLDRWLASLEREQFPAGGCAACWAPLGECQHDASAWLGPAPEAA